MVFSVVLSAFSAKLLAENIQLQDMEPPTPPDKIFLGEQLDDYGEVYQPKRENIHWTKAQCSKLPRDSIMTRREEEARSGDEKTNKVVPYLTNKNPVNHPIIDYKDPEKIFPPETLCMSIEERALPDYWGVHEGLGPDRVKGVYVFAWRKNKNEQCPGSIERNDDDWDGAIVPCTRFLEQVGGVNAPGILKDYKIDHYATE